LAHQHGLRKRVCSHLDHRLGVVGIGVQHRHSKALGDVGAVRAGAGVTRHRREADLVPEVSSQSGDLICDKKHSVRPAAF